MTHHVQRRWAHGLLAVALGGLLACGGSSNEAAIQDIETRLGELRTEVEELSQRTIELVDTTDKLQTQVDQNKQFIAKGAAGKGQDFTADIAALRQDIDALKKQIAEGAAQPRKTTTAAQAPTAAQTPATTTAPPGTAVSESGAPARPTAKTGTTPAKAAAPPSKTSTAKEPARETTGENEPAPSGHYHQVRSGETFESIASGNGIGAQSLRTANRAGASQQPMVGDRVWVPGR